MPTSTHVAEQYEREYIFTNFRRYRANFSVGGYLFDRLIGRHFTIQLCRHRWNLAYRPHPQRIHRPDLRYPYRCRNCYNHCHGLCRFHRNQ